METDTAAEPAAAILIADDNPSNREMLEQMLRHAGYTVRSAADGAAALRSAEADPPDLALLDVHMPGMEGYEVCRRMKADERLRRIPVIFLSAMAETFNKVKGFEAGAADYITKPLQFAEVRARVENHLATARLRQRLEDESSRLRALRDLGEELTQMIVHDLRSPLHALMGFHALIRREADRLSDRGRESLRRAVRNAALLARMVDALLDIARLEDGRVPLDRTDTDLVALIREAIDAAGSERLRCDAPAQPVTVCCDPELVRRIVANLIDNACRAAPRDDVRITLERARDAVRVAVRDHGPGVAAEDRERIFDKFTRGAGARPHHSPGLGLTFCRLAVEAHGGAIGVDSPPEGGSVFWFTIPSLPPPGAPPPDAD